MSTHAAADTPHRYQTRTSEHTRRKLLTLVQHRNLDQSALGWGGGRYEGKAAPSIPGHMPFGRIKITQTMHASLVRAHLDNSSAAERGRLMECLESTFHVENNSKNTDLLLSPTAVDTTLGRHPARTCWSDLSQEGLPFLVVVSAEQPQQHSNPAIIDTKHTPNAFLLFSRTHVHGLFRFQPH